MQIPFLSKNKDGQQKTVFKLPSWKAVSQKILSWWLRHDRQVLLGLFFISVVCSGLFWYYYLFLYQWNDVRKEEYRKGHFQETVFKRDTFEEALTLEQARKSAHEEAYAVPRDIFLGQ